MLQRWAGKNFFLFLFAVPNFIGCIFFPKESVWFLVGIIFWKNIINIFPITAWYFEHLQWGPFSLLILEKLISILFKNSFQPTRSCKFSTQNIQMSLTHTTDSLVLWRICSIISLHISLSSLYNVHIFNIPRIYLLKQWQPITTRQPWQ